MMNYSVPEFEVDDGADYSIPTSSHLNRKINSPNSSDSRAGEDETMELVWENGQIVMQSQRYKPARPRFEAAEIRQEEPPPPAAAAAAHNNLFMEEDEMTDWLHYPIDDSSFAHDLISELGYPAPTVTATTAAAASVAEDVRQPAPPAAAETVPYRPPVHPPEASPRFQNFALFTRHRGRVELGQKSSNNFTVAESNETPAVAAQETRAAQSLGGGGAAAGTPCGETGRGEVASSSLRGSRAGASVCAEPMQNSKAPVEDRKRKGREADVSNSHSEHDVDFDSPDAKRQGCGSLPVRKSRAAEVHNLSERKRRDRINEKMKALQELIPHSNKTDKASMLDEAIEYLKSLQLQVQMMSMGYSMVPMMFPGVQQYMTPVAAMGMGMDMMGGMTHRPMVPYSSLLPGSALPSPAHFGPRFPGSAYHMPPFHFPDPSGLQQQTTMPDPNLNPINAQNSNQPQMQSFPDPYQQYLGFQQMQMQYPQNQAAIQPSNGMLLQNGSSSCAAEPTQ